MSEFECACKKKRRRRGRRRRNISKVNWCLPMLPQHLPARMHDEVWVVLLLQPNYLKMSRNIKEAHWNTRIMWWPDAWWLQLLLLGNTEIEQLVDNSNERHKSVYWLTSGGIDEVHIVLKSCFPPLKKRSYLRHKNIVSEDWSHWQYLKMAISFNALARGLRFHTD